MQCCTKGVLLLLAVLVCSAAATLDQEERQKEERARESAREHEKGGADDIPGMPENLQVRPQGPSAMLVTWSEPSSGDADHYFVYVEGKDLEDNTKIPFKIWEDLEPCTTYTFGVKSVSSKGDLSDPALQDGLTDADRPPEPQYPRVEDYTHTAVTLAWEEPDTQCDIVLYKVRYKDDGPQTNETQVTDTTVKVSHLMPETVYTFNIYASTSEGEGPAASVKQTTAPHPGGPPQDLVAEGISSSVINVSWSEPQTPPNYYLLTAANCNYNEVEVTDLTFLIENLEPCQKCYISVDSYYSDTGTKFHEITLAVTNNDAPPEPRNLQVKNYTDTSMTLAWEKPDTQCDIVQYRVSYIDDDSQTNETQGNETTVKVSDLFPETNYTFNIYASTSTGEGPAASVKHATAPNPGGPPQDLVAEGISSSAINVSWSEPYAPPSYYLLTAANCNYNEELVYDINFIIENLEPCQRCYITVTSYYEDTDSRFTATTVAEASGGAPPAPNECSVEVKQNFITVTWEKPITPCVLGPYNVSWTLKKLWGNGEEESDSTNTLGKSYTIYNPPPYHKYTFEIAASIDEVFGSPTSCNATSLESASGPPVLVSVESEEQGEAGVIWERPAEENGKIIHYGIFVNNETNYTKQVSGDVFNTTVSLTPCVNVDISVAARNGAVNNEGWGERSEVMNVTPIGDVLPKSLDCPEPEPEVKVCWRPFDEDCPVTQYNLKWEGDVLWSPDKIDSNSITLGWDEYEICYTIPSIPYTKYNIELTVGTKLDEAIQCSSTTPMAAPGPPILEELQTEGLVITVTWQAPLEKNGNIFIYQVEWIDWNGVENLHAIDGNHFSYQIVQPSCGGEVKVTVRAMTVEIGERSPPRSAFLANSISSLTCEATKPGVIALNWKVEDLQCPVTLYNVTWTFDSLWSEDTGSGWEFVDGNSLSAVLESLPPYSTISVEVQVDNSSEKTTCTATTLEEAPGPPIVEELQTKGSVITVTWEAPLEKNGIITNYQVEWIDWNDEQNLHSTDGNTFSHQIVQPSCGGEVKVTVRAMTVEYGERSPPRSAFLVNSISNLTCEATEPGVIALNWKVEDSQCPVTLYNVTWTFDSLWSEDTGSGWKSVDGNGLSAVLELLPPFSSISVEVSVNNSSEKTTCTATTLEEVSSAPTQLHQIASHVHSLTVEWSLPEFLRGRLVGWYLYWTSAIGHFVGEHVTGDPEERVLEIRNLEPSEVYYVYVMAVNGAGRGDVALLEVATEYVPERDGDLTEPRLHTPAGDGGP